MALITIIAGVVFLVLYLDLRSRLIRLEKRSDAGSAPLPVHAGMPIQAGAPAQGVVPIVQNGMARAAAPVYNPQAVSGSSVGERFGAWLREDWLLKLGVLLLLIGFGWLVTYAFLHNWIGPMGRIAFGIICGALIMIFGWWRIAKYVHQGGIFLVLGSTVILMTVTAGQWMYKFFDAYTSLTLMFVSVAFVALASVKFHSRALSIFSLLLAAIAPMFTGVYGDEVQLFFYLMVIVLGTLWVVAMNGQRALTTTALIIVALYSMPHLGGRSEDVVLLFVYGFAAIFYLANTLGILKNKDDVTADLVTACGNGLLLLVWIMNAALPEWRSLIIVFWMVAFSAGAFVTLRLTKRLEPFYVYAGIGVAMLASATAAELDGAALVIAYTIESAIIALIIHVITRNTEAAEKSSLLLIGPMLLGLESIFASSWRMSVFHEDFFVLFTLSIVMFILGLYFMQARKLRAPAEGSLDMSTVWIVVGSIYAYILLWLSLHAAIKSDDMATMVSLFVYTAIGLATYILGRTSGRKLLLTYGGILLGFVVGRLLLVEVWHMELSGRIITFFIIGILLISTAFIGRKKREQITIT
ncbi:MAG: DUF2339 domain-containing protein [Candidatus Taylorbacteria bacterium]|nr:DUF2339 domain-containing protein [Candidatus Taylorbacteria bacterium]